MIVIGKKIMHMCNVHVAKAVLENVTLRATICIKKFGILAMQENRNTNKYKRKEGRTMKKRKVLAMMSLLLALGCTQQVLAVNSETSQWDQSGGEWYQEDGSWKYRLPDGKRAEGQTIKLDGYWVDENGLWNPNVPRWTNPNGENEQNQQESSEQSNAQAESESTDTQETQNQDEAFSNLVYPVDVISGGFTVNSVGGVTPGILFRNNSGKTIKYISFEMTPYNKVDDPVKCTVHNYSTKTCKATGSFEPDEGIGKVTYSLTSSIPTILGRDTDKPYYYTNITHEKVYLDKASYAKTANNMPGWDYVWYNSGIDYIKVTKAIVEYMDGSSDTVSCDVIMFRDRFDKYKYK